MRTLDLAGRERTVRAKLTASENGLRMKRIDAVTLHVRRHGGNITEGKSLLELNMLRVFKTAIDWRRTDVSTTGERAEPGAS